jgi:hypothetical protein
MVIEIPITALRTFTSSFLYLKSASRIALGQSAIWRTKPPTFILSAVVR